MLPPTVNVGNVRDPLFTPSLADPQADVVVRTLQSSRRGPQVSLKAVCQSVAGGSGAMTEWCVGCDAARCAHYVEVTEPDKVSV